MCISVTSREWYPLPSDKKISWYYLPACRSWLRIWLPWVIPVWRNNYWWSLTSLTQCCLLSNYVQSLVSLHTPGTKQQESSKSPFSQQKATFSIFSRLCCQGFLWLLTQIIWCYSVRAMQTFAEQHLVNPLHLLWPVPSSCAFGGCFGIRRGRSASCCIFPKRRGSH